MCPWTQKRSRHNTQWAVVLHLGIVQFHNMQHSESDFASCNEDRLHRRPKAQHPVCPFTHSNCQMSMIIPVLYTMSPPAGARYWAKCCAAWYVISSLCLVQSFCSAWSSMRVPSRSVHYREQTVTATSEVRAVTTASLRTFMTVTALAAGVI